MSVKEQTESKDSIEIKDKLTKISKKYGLLFPHKYDYVYTAYKHDAFILCCKPSSLSKSYMLYIYLERIVNLKSNSDTKTTCEPKQYHLIKITNQISSEEKISNLMLEIKKILEKSLCPGKELQTLYENNKNIILIKPQNLLYFRKLPKDCVNNPDSCLQPGDFVRVYLDGYKHAGVYIGNGKMIHVSSGLEGKILYTYQETVEKYARETAWDLFVEKRSNLDVGDFILPFRTQDDIVHSAKSFAYLEYGRGKYHVLNHNCEHFCWLCCTGEDKHELLVSPQVEDVKHAAKIGILSAAVTAIVAGAAALFITSSKKDKDKDKNKKAQKSVIKPTQDANNNDEDEKEKNPINERH